MSDTITHVVTNGVVENSIVATVEEAAVAYPDADTWLDDALYPGGPGCIWDGTKLLPPPAPEPRD